MHCSKILVLLFFILSANILHGQENFGDAPENPRQLFYSYLKKNAPDTFESYNARFYKGHLFTKNEQHAVMLYEADSGNMVEVYKRKNKAWQRVLYNDSLQLMWAQADVEVKDMNFDGKPDLLVYRTISNGYPIKSNYLFLNRDSVFKYIPQSDSLYNLTAETGNLVGAENLVWCRDGDAYGTQATSCKSYYKWEKDSLIFVRKECPCEPGE